MIVLNPFDMDNRQCTRQSDSALERFLLLVAYHLRFYERMRVLSNLLDVLHLIEYSPIFVVTCTRITDFICRSMLN